MSKIREREVNMLVGARRFGKSTFLARVLEHYEGNVLVYKEGVNLYDEAFKKFPVTPFKKYTGGKAVIDGSEIQYKDFLKEVIAHYRNGALVIDDAALYERNEVSDELYQLVIECRRSGIDIFLVFHGFTVFPIRLATYINNIILFHTTDSIKYKRGKIPSYEEIEAAKDRINAKVMAGNRFYHEVIKLS